MLSLEEARQKILEAISPIESERILLTEASGRFLTENITAPIDLPTFDNSAMDGYAVLSSDVTAAKNESAVPLCLVGKVAAGGYATGKIESGSCIRIFTGSPLPLGADAVVMQEDTRIDEKDSQTIWITDGVKPWENIRFRGEDVKSGSTIVSAGEKISVGKLSLLAALGASEVRVGKKPTVGLLATGNELVEGGKPLTPGKIYESNRIGLSTLVSRAGAVPKIYPLVSDNLEATAIALDKAFSECDCVVTSGGVSVGEFDFVKAAFEKIKGHLGFWKVAIRPGKPFIFGERHGKFLFGVPGNPVSALVTFFLLVRPALLKMQGAKKLNSNVGFGTLTEPISNVVDRRHFVRVKIDSLANVRSTGTQASHILSSLAEADGLIDVPPKTTILAGETVKVLLWD